MAADRRATPDDAADACRRLLQATDAVAAVPSPMPYKRRRPSSFRVTADGRAVVATCRDNPARGAIERAILTTLGAAGAPVPEILAHDERWLVQADVGNRRLSALLAICDPAKGERLLHQALDALVRCQQAGAALAQRLPRVDGRAIQLGSLGEVGRLLGLAAPAVPDALTACLDAAPRQHFVKWDARPGNAIVGDDGRLRWIDWEHASRGEPLEDVAWLLADEWVPDWPDVETRLLDRHLGKVLRRDGGRHRDYLAVFGVLHMTVRLQMILRMKENGPWWDTVTCLEHDLLGVTRETCARLAGRARRWAGWSPASAPLAPWLAAVADRLASLD